MHAISISGGSDVDGCAIHVGEIHRIVPNVEQTCQLAYKCFDRLKIGPQSSQWLRLTISTQTPADRRADLPAQRSRTPVCENQDHLQNVDSYLEKTVRVLLANLILDYIMYILLPFVP